MLAIVVEEILQNVMLPSTTMTKIYRVFKDQMKTTCFIVSPLQAKPTNETIACLRTVYTQK
jgi:hypothetical protein